MISFNHFLLILIIYFNIEIDLKFDHECIKYHHNIIKIYLL